MKYLPKNKKNAKKHVNKNFLKNLLEKSAQNVIKYVSTILALSTFFLNVTFLIVWGSSACPDGM